MEIVDVLLNVISLIKYSIPFKVDVTCKPKDTLFSEAGEELTPTKQATIIDTFAKWYVDSYNPNYKD